MRAESKTQLRGDFHRALTKNDLGRISRDGTKIDFNSGTVGGTDGFDFKLSPQGTTVNFDLRNEATVAPEHVKIGRDGVPAPGTTFTFPADPGATPNP